MKGFIFKFWAGIIVSFVLFSSCNKEDVLTDVEINFKLLYGPEPLVMLESYEYPDGREILFNRFSFYASEISFDDDQLTDIDYIDLTSSHSEADLAEEGFKFLIKDVKIGEYSSITFNIGVPPMKNDMEPADFEQGDLLASLAEYWTGWKSFIFARLEGQIDLDRNGSKETGFSLHTGGNEALRKVVIIRSFILTQGRTSQIDVNIDIKKVFDNQKLYDIDSNPQIHTPNQQEQVLELSDNYLEAFKG